MRARSAFFLCVCLAAQSAAQDDDLKARLDAIEAGIARYKTNAAEGEWLTDARAAEVRALVLDVLHDADTRLNLTDGPAGLFASTVFGDLDREPLQVMIQAKFLLVSNHLLDDAGVSFGDDDHRTGFENPQTRATLAGGVHGAQFRVEGDFNELGDMRLQDAWIGRQEGRVFLQAGQFKPPFSYESLIDDFQLTTVLRSLQARAAAERVQGVKATFNASERARIAASFNDGIASANSPWDEEDVEGAVTIRVDFVAVNDFNNDLGIDNFADLFTNSAGGSGLLIGGGAHYQKGESGTPADEIDLFSATADATAKLDWLVVHAAGYYNDIENGVDGQTLGTVIMLVPRLSTGDNDVHLYLRHEFIDVELGDADDDSQIVSVGLTTALAGGLNDVRLTTEVGYSDGIPLLGDLPLIGSLFKGSDFRGGDREELVILIQAQISTDHEW
jgi:hypothetical protein